MRLVAPSAVLREAFLDLARECVAAGDPRYALAVRDFDAYLKKLEVARYAHLLPEGRAPSVERWLEHGGRIVGCARLRLRLTPDLEHEGGHVGYDVRPSMRRRGYGTALLQRALLEARELGIHRVQVTCDDDNLGSIRVIENNGGVLIDRVVSNLTGKMVRRYAFGS